MREKILIIEDEKKLASVMKLYLEKEGYKVQCAYDGEEGFCLAGQQDYDLIVLDIMMPKIDGWSLLRKIKASMDVAVIITTARGEEEDRIFGLELGADDYMVKPISMKELVLRVALRIKSKDDKRSDILHEKAINYGSMFIDEQKREVKEYDNILSLTPKEFELLVFLARNPNIVFKRDVLLSKVWEYDFEGDSRTVDTHVKNLREKIAYCRENLKTVWGVGYKFHSRNGE